MGDHKKSATCKPSFFQRSKFPCFRHPSRNGRKEDLVRHYSS